MFNRQDPQLFSGMQSSLHPHTLMSSAGADSALHPPKANCSNYAILLYSWTLYPASEVFYVGKEFATVDDAYSYLQCECKEERGYGVRRGVVKRSRMPPHPIICRSFVCDKEGVKNTVDKRQKSLLVNLHTESRVSCPVGTRIRLTALKRLEGFLMSIQISLQALTKCSIYNHYSHRTHRSKACRSIMSNLDQEGIRASKIARVVNVLNVGQDGEQVATQQSIDHIRKKSNNINNQCISTIKSFQDRRKVDPDFYFVVEVDLDGTMRSVFWEQDPRI